MALAFKKLDMGANFPLTRLQPVKLVFFCRPDECKPPKNTASTSHGPNTALILSGFCTTVKSDRSYVTACHFTQVLFVLSINAVSKSIANNQHRGSSSGLNLLAKTKQKKGKDFELTQSTKSQKLPTSISMSSPK